LGIITKNKEAIMMKTLTKRVTAVLQAFLCVTFACSMSFAAEQSKQKQFSATAPPKQATAVPLANTGPVIQGNTTIKICSDPYAALMIAKSLSQGTGVLTLKGTICNKGPGNYTGVEPLQAHFYAITSNGFKDIKTIDIQGILKNGECRVITQTYNIPNVVMWGHTAAKAATTMHPAEQEISVQIEKYGSIGILSAEDCNIGNNKAFEKVMYMEKQQTTLPSVQIQDKVLTIPDLIAQSISVTPSAPKAGDTMGTFVVSVKNEGTAPSKPNKALFGCLGQGCPSTMACNQCTGYAVELVTAAGMISRWQLPSLAPSQSMQFTFTPPAQTKWEKGSYAFDLMVDRDNAVQESNEGNNKKTIGVTVQ
jgi:hypothetical protein